MTQVGHIWLAGRKGSIYVAPGAVAAIETSGPHGDVVIHLIGGQSLTLDDERPAEEIVLAVLGPDIDPDGLGLRS